MGVAFGRFIPTEAYSSIQSTCVKGESYALPLLVRTGEGRKLTAVSVTISDYEADLGEIQVEVCGISDPPYEELFPQHVRLYREQYPPTP